MLLLAPKLNEKTLNYSTILPNVRWTKRREYALTKPYAWERSHHSTCSKVLVSAFLRSLKDPFSPARISGLRAMSATKEYYNTMDIATKLLPALCGVFIDHELGAVKNATLNHVFMTMRSNHSSKIVHMAKAEE